jgi:hypothetical protein
MYFAFATASFFETEEPLSATDESILLNDPEDFINDTNPGCLWP